MPSPEDECNCDREMTNLTAMEFVIIGSKIVLRCRRCNSTIRWWNEDTEKIIPFRRRWSDKECSLMR
jgi:hypothetical protein